MCTGLEQAPCGEAASQASVLAWPEPWAVEQPSHSPPRVQQLRSTTCTSDIVIMSDPCGRETSGQDSLPSLCSAPLAPCVC
jgi:hypothetical protein